jgi:hypothetical protein
MPEDFDPFSRLSEEQTRAVLAEMMSSSALDNVDTIPEVETNEMPPQGNKCCEDLRTELLRLKSKYQGTVADLIFDYDMQHIDEATCEEVEEGLESSIQYVEHLLSKDIDPDARAMLHREDPQPFTIFNECLEDLQQAKLEYEACKMGGFGDVDHDMFYASVDPFEYSWNLIIKELGGFE